MLIRSCLLTIRRALPIFSMLWTEPNRHLNSNGTNCGKIFTTYVGSFNNYVDIILPYFDYLPTLMLTFFTLNVDKNRHFLTAYPPHLVHLPSFWTTLMEKIICSCIRKIKDDNYRRIYIFWSQKIFLPNALYSAINLNFGDVNVEFYL